MHFQTLLVVSLLAACYAQDLPENVDIDLEQEQVEDTERLIPSCHGDTCHVTVKVKAPHPFVRQGATRHIIADDDTPTEPRPHRRIVADDDAPAEPRASPPRRITADTDDAEEFNVASGTFESKSKPSLFSFNSGFIAGERFALFNPQHTRCLTVKTNKRSNFSLRTQACSPDQRIRRQSKVTFHWKKAENNLALLAWTTPSGRELCALHRWMFGTEFFECGAHSTRYSLGSTDYKGRFMIKNNEKMDACMSTGYYFEALNMLPCTSTRSQKWTKVPSIDASG